MKYLVVSMALILMASMPGWSAQMPDRKMDGMEMNGEASEPVSTTTGEIKSLDPAKGTVTLAHDPVPALKWPAMTMSFLISSELAKGLKVGQRVKVEFRAKGMAATITTINVLP